MADGEQKTYDSGPEQPDDIRDQSQSQLRTKQTNLRLAFWMLTVGLAWALLPAFLASRSVHWQSNLGWADSAH